MNKYWFRPKTYGYGATPATWEGWALTAAYVVVVLAVVRTVVLRETLTPATVTFVAIATALFISVSWLKTDGVWKWRSGTNFNGKE